MLEHTNTGELHLLELRWNDLTNRVSDTKRQPGVNPRTEKLEEECSNDSIFSVSAFGHFFCFDLSDSCPQRYPKQAFAAVTDS